MIVRPEADMGEWRLRVELGHRFNRTEAWSTAGVTASGELLERRVSVQEAVGE
jgi:hypothetical protein